MSGPNKERSRICEIKLDERTVVRRSADVEQERAIAIFDLVEENYFAPAGHGGGPYHLHLAIEENRLMFDIRSEAEAEVAKVSLPLLPFRRIVKDYFCVCEVYYDAIKTASPSKIEIDFDTARRLFTLLCVLHIRG